MSKCINLPALKAKVPLLLEGRNFNRTDDIIRADGANTSRYSKGRSCPICALSMKNVRRSRQTDLPRTSLTPTAWLTWPRGYEWISSTKSMNRSSSRLRQKPLPTALSSKSLVWRPTTVPGSVEGSDEDWNASLYILPLFLIALLLVIKGTMSLVSWGCLQAIIHVLDKRPQEGKGCGIH